MVMNCTEPTYPSTVCFLNDEPIKNVEIFAYLGCMIKYNEPYTGDEELNLRIESAEAKLYEHGKKFFNCRISLPVRVTLFNSLVRSRLTYGCQTWLLTAQQKRRINSSHTLMLRKMVRNGFHRKEDQWSYKITNEHLLRICKTETIDNFVYKLKTRYLAHIIRCDDEAITEQVVLNEESHGRSLIKSVTEQEGYTDAEFYARAIQKNL